MELGVSNGFDFQLQDRGGLGHEKLMEARNQLLGMAMKNKKLVAVRPNGQDDSPQFKLDIDDVRAGAWVCPCRRSMTSFPPPGGAPT